MPRILRTHRAKRLAVSDKVGWCGWRRLLQKPALCAAAELLLCHLLLVPLGPPQVLALGTDGGVVHVLDYEGNEVGARTS